MLFNTIVHIKYIKEMFIWNRLLFSRSVIGMLRSLHIIVIHHCSFDTTNTFSLLILHSAYGDIEKTTTKYNGSVFSKAINFVNHLLNASKWSCHFHSCRIFRWAQSLWTIIIRNTLEILQNDSIYNLNKPTCDNIVNKLLDAILGFWNRQVSS